MASLSSGPPTAPGLDDVLAAVMRGGDLLSPSTEEDRGGRLGLDMEQYDVVSMGQASNFALSVENRKGSPLFVFGGVG